MSEPGVWVAATTEQILAAEKPVLARLGDDPLMDRAADAVATEARTILAARGDDAGEGGIHGAHVVVLAGTGKNGGDALLAGAILAREGATVIAVLTGASAHERGLSLLRDAGGAVLGADDAGVAAAIARADLILDGIVGLGASPGLREPAATLVEGIQGRTRVVSVDLPSGLAPDSATLDAPHVHATVTVTFTAPKPCLLLPPAALVVGRIVVAHVGIPVPEATPDAPRRLTPEGAAALWPVPGTGDDKYTRGIVGIVAGSDRYPGAAILACSAAVRAGAGLVRYLGPRRVQDLVLAARPEVVAADPFGDQSGAPDGASLPRVDAWVIGPGVADEPDQAAAIAAVLASGVPVVIDAGAIEACVVARAAGTRPAAADRVLLTPHAGELARALAAVGLAPTAKDAALAIASDPAGQTRLLARTADATVLLKGAVTLVATPDGRLWSQADAPAWLATAGAGDILAGIAGMLLASGIAADRAGALAALIHGRAATLASGGGPLAALDVAEALPASIEALNEAIRGLLANR